VLANKVVHASPQGTFGRLSVYKPTGIIPAGHSDYGIAVPAEHSAISLTVVTTHLLTVMPYGEGLVNIECLDKWIDVVRKYYFEAEDNCFSEDNESRAIRVSGFPIKIPSNEE